MPSDLIPRWTPVRIAIKFAQIAWTYLRRNASKQESRASVLIPSEPKLRENSRRLKQGLADEIRRVAGAQFAHGFCAMALEGSWADVHPHGALLVRAAFADQAQNFTLALRQRLLAGLGGKHHAPRALDIQAAAAGLALPLLLAVRVGSLRRMIVRHLLHQRADALGLLKRVFHHLLQVDAIAGRLRELVAVLLDLIHIEQQRGQRSVQLPGNRCRRLLRRPRAGGG